MSLLYKYLHFHTETFSVLVYYIYNCDLSILTELVMTNWVHDYFTKTNKTLLKWWPLR